MQKYLYLLLAFVATSAVMMGFEFTNSFFFPFPEGLDTNNLEVVRAFSSSLPYTAMIMVFLGWLFGTIVGTIIILKKIGEVKFAYILAGILTFFALANNYLFVPEKIWVQFVTVPFFFLVVHFTSKYLKI